MKSASTEALFSESAIRQKPHRECHHRSLIYQISILGDAIGSGTHDSVEQCKGIKGIGQPRQTFSDFVII
jgi:hypothetical protein